MQQTSGLAKRYARALFRLSGGSVPAARKLLEGFATLEELFTHESAAKVLKSPVMPKDLKLKLLEYALSLQPDDRGTRGFVHSITDAGRVAELPQIISSFRDLIDEKEGKIKAQVASFVPLKPEMLEKLKTIIGGGKQVELDNVVDPSLLGGMVVTLGNKIVDMSLKSKLNDMAQSVLS